MQTTLVILFKDENLTGFTYGEWWGGYRVTLVVKLLFMVWRQLWICDAYRLVQAFSLMHTGF